MSKDKKTKEPSFFIASLGMGALILSILAMMKIVDPEKKKNSMSFLAPSSEKKDSLVLNKDKDQNLNDFEKSSYQNKTRLSISNSDMNSSHDDDDDHNIPNLLAQAVALLDSGQAQEAEKILKEILEKDPDNENAITELGMLYLIDYKDGERAKPYLEKSLEIRPDSKVILSELLNIYKETDHLNDGIEFLQTLHQKNPENSEISHVLGEALLTVGRTEESLKILSQVIDSSENTDMESLNQYAQALSESGQKESALDAHKKILDFELEKAQKSGVVLDEQTQEKIAKARMEVVGDYMDLQNQEKAKEELEKIKEDLGEEAYQKLIEGYMAKSE